MMLLIPTWLSDLLTLIPLRDFALAIASGVIGGLVVLGVQELSASRRERRKEIESLTVKNSNAERVITDDIFFTLSPGKSVALMKHMLGAATAFSRRDFGVFSEAEIQTNSYIYGLKNAWVKITSVDNESIDTLTILDGAGLSVEHLFFPCNQKSYEFHEVQVCRELIEQTYRHKAIQTIRDSSFALQQNLGPPHGVSVTYFGHHEELWEYYKSTDENLLLGGVITGVCISFQEAEAFFIYDSELR